MDFYFWYVLLVATGLFVISYNHQQDMKELTQIKNMIRIVYGK